MDDNEVEIDQAALAAEADAALAGAGEQSGAPGPMPPEAELLVDEVARAEVFAQKAAPMVGKVLGGLLKMAAPNWQVTQSDRQDLAQSTAFALALWFPHEIPPKWAALMMVGMSLSAIAENNRDDTGALKPLRAKAKRPASAPVEA